MEDGEEEGEEAAQLFVSASSRSGCGCGSAPHADLKHGGETPKLSPFPPTSFSLATQRGGSGSEELEQKILEGVQAPLGVPQGSIRVQLGCQEEQLPVLVHRAQRQSFVQLRHARGVHFVLSEEGGKKKKSLQISLTAADTQEVFLTGVSNSNLARAR